MDKKSTGKEIIIYIFVGILTTIVGWGSYALAVNFLKFSVFWANLISWFLAASFAFVTNKLWVFGSKSKEKKTVAREAVTFFSARGATGILEIVLVPLLEKWSFDKPFFSLASAIGLHQKIFITPGIYSKIFVSVIIVVFNYFFSKFFVFKKDKKK